MKLSDFLRIEALVNARNHLIGLKDEGRIEVTIGGHHQSREFINNVETAIRLELRYQIHELEQQLIELGVDVSA
jgi:hypothetical protein